MKSMSIARTYFILFSLMSFLMPGVARAQVAMTGARIAFVDTAHNFGRVPLSTQVVYNFEFQNAGDALLVVTEAQPSCSCIKTNWNRSPLMPGDKGSLEVVYQAEDLGVFDKGIWVTSNTATGQPVELRIRGDVVLPGTRKSKPGKKH